jgi:hypothetical protein
MRAMQKLAGKFISTVGRLAVLAAPLIPRLRKC